MSHAEFGAGSALRDGAVAPNRFVIRDLMSTLGPSLGLKAPVLHTLDVLLSFLPPTRDHHMVFASNASLLARAQGLSERSLRRHLQLLAEAGLLARQSSANGKRFARRSAEAVLHFGLDLTPLFEKLPMIAEMAAQLRAEAQHAALIRQQIRAACQSRLARDPHDPLALDSLRLLRRKLDQDRLIALRDSLAEALPQTSHPVEVTAKDGQNGRHHKSKIKDITIKQDFTSDVEILCDACPDALTLAPRPVTDWTAASDLAKNIHPSLGITAELYNKAQRQIGVEAVTIVIWRIIQCFSQIRNAAAYFASLTCGPQSKRFDPVQWLRRLSADNERRDLHLQNSAKAGIFAAKRSHA